MFLIDKNSGDLMRVDDIESLSDPFIKEVLARDQTGEEEQDWGAIPKQQLEFPSGENLPRCWTDPDYRNG